MADLVARALAKRVTPDRATFIISSSNLLNKATLDSGYTFDSATGSKIANATYGLSDFIKVSPNGTYSSKNIAKVGRYDINKNYINNHAPATLNGSNWVTTTTTEYVRVVVPLDGFSIAQINLGNSVLAYEPFGLKFDPSIRREDPPKDFWVEDKYIVEGKTSGNFTSSVVPALTTLQTYTTSQIIALYDELMASNPDYITKTALGTDSLGENIYRYDFKPRPVPTVYVSNQKVNTKFPKMILIAGMHGEEKAGVYNLYQSLKQITENWKNDELLETLRWNVNIIVIPIVNNYGFNNSVRKNENGVDLARNFTAGWELNTALPADPTYAGTTPFSEKGSQIISQVIQDNKDAIYFTSFHNFTAADGSNDFIWGSNATKLQVNLVKQLVSKMTRKWKKEYNWLPQDNTTFLGYSDASAPNGSEGMYAASLGIQAGTFEVSAKMPYEPSAVSYSSIAITLGVEAFINWLVINLRENVAYYNGGK